MIQFFKVRFFYTYKFNFRKIKTSVEDPIKHNKTVYFDIWEMPFEAIMYLLLNPFKLAAS